MPGAIPFADTNALSLFGGMLDGEGRFVASVLPRLHADCSIELLSRAFDAKFHRVFPQSPALIWRHRWQGIVGVVPDRIPRLYRLGNGALAALGYSGAGIALATAVGRELARVLTGTAASCMPVPIVEPKRLPLTRVSPALVRAVVAPLARLTDYFY